MPLIRGRLRRRRRPGGERPEDVFEIDATRLTGVFNAPGWLRDAGVSAWLLVGITLLLVGLVWLLTLTSVIVLPVLTASVIAAVAGQLVSLLARHHVPRGVGAVIVLLLIVGSGALACFLILRGIASETAAISTQLNGAVDEIQSAMRSLGIDSAKADSAGSDLAAGASDSFQVLKSGLVSAVESLSSLVFFLAMTALSLMFLLIDGPSIRSWTERHMGVPPEAAHTITGRTLQSLRGYFLGVTIVAVFNAVLVGGGALLLGVPLAATIAVVTFIGAYVPYLGAWSAGAFSVLIALGGASPEAAAGMVAIQVLSNGPLQQIVQPIAYGAALGIHPLAVLIVTIAGGALFGAIGLILAAPLTSAVVRISADLGRGREETEAAAVDAPGEEPAPPPDPAPA